MSRTYRRTKKTPSWVGVFTTYRNGTFGTHLWEYRNDKFNCNPWSKGLKEYTNRKRRRDEQHQIHHLLKDENYDEYNKEKEYLGYVWLFD